MKKMSLAFPLMLLIAACDFGPLASDSATGVEEARTDDPPSDENNLDEPLLPSVPEKASQLALLAVRAVAGAAATTLPVKDLQPIFEAGLPPPACPTLDAILAGRDLQLNLDYASGCASDYFDAAVIRGQLHGIYYTAYNAFDLVLEDVFVSDESLLGSASGRVDVVDGVTTVFLNVNVALQSFSIRGSVTVVLESPSGAMRLNGTDLTLVEVDGLPQSITLTGVRVDAVSNPDLTPHAGAVKIVTTTPDTTTVRFTSTTPTSGDVVVE